MSESRELEQLQELIKQFPAKFSVDQAEKANRVAQARYEALDNTVIPNLQEKLDEDGISFTSEVCFKLCHFFHYEIFKDITSAAGEFRKFTDSKEGSVYFGGVLQTELRPQFSGSKPKDIEEDLTEAFAFLFKSKEDSAVENALKFYQKFVFTHPFYDGNGRVARLFVNLYLLDFNLYINWKSLQGKGKFLKKLNYYHKTGIEEHFQWWLNFCRYFIHEIGEEDVE